MTQIAVQGQCGNSYTPVYEAFTRIMAQSGERGGSVALYHQGEMVVNLWTGTRDKACTQPWQEDTLVNVFSTSKGVAALAVQKALDLGLLELERPVSYYWPEYGREGKKDTRVGWILNHRAGQPAFKTPLPDEALFDWERMTQTLAAESPWWQPGSRHGYHMISFGWLLGEVFQRAVGVTIGQFLQSELAQPLGLDMHLGLGEAELARVADLAASREPPMEGRVYLFEKVINERESITARALSNPPSLMTSSNSLPWRTMELPSANLHATAAALAGLFGKVACGEALSVAALERCQQEESAGDDPVLCTRTRFGPGVMLQQVNDIEAGFGPGLKAFGHPGSGGSLAFADPERGLGFAWVMNQMGPYVLIDPRARELTEAVYTSLAQA